MEEKKKSLVVITLISLVVLVVDLFLLLYEVILYQQNIVIVYREKLAIQLVIFAVTAGILIYLVMKKCTNIEKRNWILHKGVAIFFCVYVIGVCFVVFRDISIEAIKGCASMEYYKMQLTYSTNFIPFRVFTERGNYSTSISYYVQLFGNLVLFVPYGLLSPILWKKIRKTKMFLVITILLLFLVETIQFLCMCGSWDIDDIWLNLFGALLGFGMYKYGSR